MFNKKNELETSYSEKKDEIDNMIKKVHRTLQEAQTAIPSLPIPDTRYCIKLANRHGKLGIVIDCTFLSKSFIERTVFPFLKRHLQVTFPPNK